MWPNSERFCKHRTIEYTQDDGDGDCQKGKPEFIRGHFIDLGNYGKNKRLQLHTVIMTVAERASQSLIPQHVSAKGLQRRGGWVELIAKNPDYVPSVVNGPLVIERLVVRLIRGGRAL